MRRVVRSVPRRLDRACERGNSGGWPENVPDVGVKPLEAFSGENKEIVVSFIAHGREEGGLCMY
jgi:hypothetical protein